IFGSVITFSLYYWLLRHLPAKRMALVAYVVPVIAVAIGWLRDEALTARMLIGSAIVLAAVSLVARAGAVELHE
ncbi:MAG: EamA family transporter, partial [Acidobacteriota bacterium]